MKLLLCPPGYVGARVKVGDRDVRVEIEQLPGNERGYTIVEDDVAEALVKSNPKSAAGYEILPMRAYPRDINNLYAYIRRHLREAGVKDIPSAPNLEIRESHTMSANTQALSASFSIEPCQCLPCKAGRGLSRLFGRTPKVHNRTTVTN